MTSRRLAPKTQEALQREGAALDGERGQMYSARENEVDAAAFIDRGAEDRHQFRLIVAPRTVPS